MIYNNFDQVIMIYNNFDQLIMIYNNFDQVIMIYTISGSPPKGHWSFYPHHSQKWTITIMSDAPFYNGKVLGL